MSSGAVKFKLGYSGQASGSVASAATIKIIAKAAENTALHSSISHPSFANGTTACKAALTKDGHIFRRI